MDEAQFWSIIEHGHAASLGDMDQKDRMVKDAVQRLSGPEAEEFLTIFRSMMHRAYTWPLWGAAFVINGGCGDDIFSDFRASLISRGRAAFEKALVDPDSLADENDLEGLFHEGFEYAVTDGVKIALGQHPTRKTPAPSDPTGERWTEATVHAAFPRLSFRMKPSVGSSG